MIQYIHKNKINIKKWDACIDNSNAIGSFTAYSWYLDSVCDDWAGLVWNDYEAVFPIAFKSKFKIKYVYQPFFTRHFGVFSQHEVETNLLYLFLKELPSIYIYIKCCVNISVLHHKLNYDLKVRTYQELSLNETYFELHKKFSKNVKRNIKKANYAHLEIQQTVEPRAIVDLFRYSKGVKLKEYKNKNYIVLENLMNLLIAKNMAYTIAVYDEKILCAAAFFIKCNNRFHFLKGAVSKEGKEKGAMHLLFDFFIREHADKNYMLDFGGSSIDSLARFNKSFGAKDCLYLQIKRNSLPSLINKLRGQ